MYFATYRIPHLDPQQSNAGVFIDAGSLAAALATLLVHCRTPLTNVCIQCAEECGFPPSEPDLTLNSNPFDALQSWLTTTDCWEQNSDGPLDEEEDAQ